LALQDAAGFPESTFTEADVEQINFCAVDDKADFTFGDFIPVQAGLTFTVARTSHVLGSVGFSFQFDNGAAGKEKIRHTIYFSGDVGNNTDQNLAQPLLNARYYPCTHAQYIVCESTYGGRNREPRFKSFEDRVQALHHVLDEATRERTDATVLFPCFTLQRIQDLQADLYYVLNRQASDVGGWGAEVTLHSDSPQAMEYGEIFARELSRKRSNGKPYYLNAEFYARMNIGHDVGEDFFRELFTQDKITWGAPENAKTLRIILAGTGMCHGGKIVEHLKRFLPSPDTTVIFTGYQGSGTPGSQLLGRAKDSQSVVKLPEDWEVDSDEIQARVVDFSGYYSGHADEESLIDFLLTKDKPKIPYQPLRRIFLTHGEDQAREALKCRLLAEQAKRGHRSVAAVELPRPLDGWFDLLKDEWSGEISPQVDGLQFQVAALHKRVQKLEQLLLLRQG
jgi:metallo-beta-lactamase family protein